MLAVVSMKDIAAESGSSPGKRLNKDNETFISRRVGTDSSRCGPNVQIVEHRAVYSSSEEAIDF